MHFTHKCTICTKNYRENCIINEIVLYCEIIIHGLKLNFLVSDLIFFPRHKHSTYIHTEYKEIERNI